MGPLGAFGGLQDTYAAAFVSGAAAVLEAAMVAERAASGEPGDSGTRSPE